METITTTTETTTPRAWVGCLGCYNSGSLNGSWVEGINAGDITQAVKVSIGDPSIYGENCPVCVKCGSDEFWVFDHENFNGVLSGECSPSEAQEYAELLESAGDDLDMFKAWIASGMGNDLDQARDSFIGEFSTDTELGEYLADELGALSIPEDSILARYFDYESYGRDCSYDLHNFNGYFWWNN